ncbi:MAG: right-handed parallel beta-helix repeat-containing protein, partial [Mucilaginibacter sp.]
VKSINTDNTITKKVNYKLSLPIILNGAHDMVINGLQIQNLIGACIYLTNCRNITISNCKLGPSPQKGIELYKCTNIIVDSCYIANTATGMYALESSSIQFNDNDVKNIQGPFPGGQMVQFDNVRGAGNRILSNKCENIAGASNPEDVISMYMSNGTAADPILIAGNWIRGGGPSKVGGGIMLGDNGGSYIAANKNILVNPGNYGIAIAGGNNLQITDNQIYSSATTVSNVGIYIWNQSSRGCSLNTISNNQVNWTSLTGETNNNWNSGNCGAVIGWNTNTWGASLNENILPAQIITN